MRIYKVIPSARSKLTKIVFLLKNNYKNDFFGLVEPGFKLQHNLTKREITAVCWNNSVISATRFSALIGLFS